MKKLWLVFILLAASLAHAQDPLPAPTPVEVPSTTPTIQQSSPAAAPQSSMMIPTTLRPDPISFNAKLGIGYAFEDAFWMSVTGEVQLDKFVAFGPMFQWGQSSSTDYIMFSFGPRFIIPISYFEISVHTGLGTAYRTINGFEFYNFLYETGISMELYLLKNLSLGLGYNANVMSSEAEAFISALMFNVAGHF